MSQKNGKIVDLDKIKEMLDMLASQTVDHDKSRREHAAAIREHDRWLREHEKGIAEIRQLQKAAEKRSDRMDRKLEALIDAHIRAEKRLTGLERKRR